MSAKDINRIVFINPQGQICTIAPDGTNLSLLTDPARTFQFPAWSPNGKYIAAIGLSRHGRGVYALPDQPEANLRKFHHSTIQTPFYLYWSPNSQWISFIASHPKEGIGFHLASLRTETNQMLTTGQPFFWCWTPNSQQLFIHTGADEARARLAFIVPGSDGKAANIARPSLFQAPGIASSGRFWAFGSMDSSGNHRLVIESTTGERLTRLYRGELALSWSPVQTQLAYIYPAASSQQRFFGPLRLLETTTRKVRTLTEATVLAFFWSPDGQKIAYITPTKTANQTNASPSNTTPRQSSNGMYKDHHLQLAHSQPPQLGIHRQPLDLWLLQLTDGSRQRLLTFDPQPFFANQFLPFFDQYALSHRLWSPDSDALILPIVEDNIAQISVVPIDGHTPKIITQGTMAFWSHQ